ncbi:non-ribosomal peptide synthase/polyketide synthase [Xenorhabdus sp. PB62.4]|uniref:non-ribosomal peptide synthase/polyketide synthase n=1 Tax=Xenorhabdus sp. PB62.4 TaxID=1851573 RepID=UPI0016575620|nr:non-ribosomal peptide synthase/polyketide synthase [Xenorhabdus sp. PB62.4]MBC8953654.1 Amino acid adenylation [Xenorhabdus sp. PB62.4]
MKNDKVMTLSTKCEQASLSTSQEQKESFHHIKGHSENHHISASYRLVGNLNIDLFKQALNALSVRHNILCSTWIKNNFPPVVDSLNEDISFSLVISDLRTVDEQEKRGAQVIDEIINTPFDFTQGSLLKAALILLNNDEYIFLLNQHPVISDYYSVSVLIHELCVIYNDLLNHRAISLPPPTHHAIPATYPRFNNLFPKGDICAFTLDKDLTSQLKQISQKHGVTLLMTVMTAWAIVLNRLSGQDSVVIGTPFANKNITEIKNITELLTNILPIRIDIDDDTTIEELLAQVSHTMINAQDNQDMPFEHFVEAISPENRVAYPSVFQSVINWLNYFESEYEFEGIKTSPIDYYSNIAKIDLELFMYHRDGEIIGGINYATALFDKQVIERQLNYFVIALRTIAKNRVQRVEDIDILPADERALLLNQWNDTAGDYPSEHCIHELLEWQAIKTPQAPALVFNDHILSYAELNQQANQLAHRLIAEGVIPDSRVAICVDRTPLMVIGLLAILKAGGAYVPLDPNYPAARLHYILDDADPVLLLQDEIGTNKLHGISVTKKRLDINAVLAENVELSAENPCVIGLSSRNLAYVIYTSGSTGNPKGVQNEHRSVMNRLYWIQQTYHLTPDDVVLQKTTFSFDVSVWELFCGFINGAKMVLATTTQQKNLSLLVELINQEKVTTLHFVPSVLTTFLKESDVAHCVTLKHLFCSGEALHPITVKHCQALMPWVRIYNLYGPTEAAIDVTYWHCPDNFDGQVVPIGKPITNSRIYLLDNQQRPVPLGAVGELYIGGVGVARGYLNQPELTAERFLADPFHSEPDARMYRSGDLARYDHDGNIEYIGRNDYQVKIRGFRIELGEIETALETHPQVQQAAVIAYEGIGGDKRLVAYVVLVQGNESDQAAGMLRQHLLSALPEYMVPAAFVVMAHFPLTPNGKLDRKALPEPDSTAYQRQYYQSPQGETENLLAEMWSQLLGINNISRFDNFFTLGGHSLLIVQLMGLLREKNYTVQSGALFSKPILAEQAALLIKIDDTFVIPPNLIGMECERITPELLPLIDIGQADIDRLISQIPDGVTNIQDIYALSPLQDGILFHHLLEDEGDPYLLTRQIVFANRFLLDRYLTALQQVVDRHDILRTVFIWQGLSVPAQVVLRQVTLSVIELTLDPVDGPVHDQLAQHFNPSHYRLDLGQAPLLHLAIAQETDGRWIALQLQHHLIGDHVTMEMMNSEVRAYLAGQGDKLPASAPFRNLVAQARLGASQTEHTHFFTGMLAEVVEPTLSFGVAEVHHDGSQTTESHRRLAPELNERLRCQAKRLGVSLAALCHLAWAQVVSRTSGQRQVVFGTLLFGRMQVEEGSGSGMGLFINTLPLRLDVGETSVRDSVQETHKRLAELLAHEHASLALAQRCSGVASGTPLFNTLLNYRYSLLPEIAGDVLNGIEFFDEQERTNYPFALSVDDFGNALGLTAQVVHPFDPVRICGYMQQALESLVEALEQSPETPIQALEILPETERTLLLTTWNVTETAYYEQLCVHQLFEQQVEKTPDATALVYEAQTLSYAELNARANRLAHQLIVLGVEPDQRVAICVTRSLAMVVGLLAVLKAGGAYVPLDPTYPGERLTHILADAAPAILLADNAGCIALGDEALADLIVLDPNSLPVLPDSNPQIPALTSRHLAYVIYTSGSTGRPKGVMVEHSSLLNLHGTLTQRVFANSPVPYRVSLNASISFDAALQNLLGLLNGYTLVIVPQAVRADSVAFLQFLTTADLDVLDCTPMQLEMLLTAGLYQHKKALILLVGGEAISPQTWQAVASIPQLTAYNVYGPTECTVDATLARIEPDQLYPTMGRPLDNTRLYLLDNAGYPVPLGAVGELYISGAGVARGYLNQPELTAERFLSDPFSDKPDARMYRTGDLARYLPDGNLEFLGRNDQQVKIRGFRIEPGEIEARLTEYPTVSEAVVMTQGEGQGRRLVAYVVAPVDDRLINHLRVHLSKMLPDYMVPAAFVRLDALPLTPNGKLDRRALPAPDEKAFARQTYEAPQGEMEITLAVIWRELLGIEQIGRYDNFFALGGHSLLAVRMMNRIAALDIELPLSTLFKSPTLAGFAEVIETRFGEQDNRRPAILPIPRNGQLPLSFSQQRLWFLAQFEGISQTYHIPMALRLRGQLNIDIWQQALDALFTRHEALRSVFVSIDGQPQVELLSTDLGLPIRKYDLRKAPDVDEQLERLCAQETEAPFNLVCGPLIRASLIQLADDDYIFLLTQHHIVSDGWSVDVLMRELNTCYVAFLAGQPNPLPPLTVQYPDYAAWQRQWFSVERLQSQSDYWRTALAGVPVLLDLPTDRPRPPEQSFAGDLVPVVLEPALTASLKRLSEQQGTTLFMTLLSAWAIVLARLSGQAEVVIGTPSAGRNHQTVESLIGFFVNTLALRVDLSGEPNTAELLARVKQTALAAQEHQDLPFEQVVEIVQPSRQLAHTPLFQVMFAWQNNGHTGWELPGLAVSPADVLLNTVKFDLELNLFEEEGRIVGALHYATALFDKPTLERHVGYLHAVLQAMVADLQQPVGKIAILAPAERRLLLEKWNSTEIPYLDLCIHQMFEQQAGKTPEATALVYEEQTFSYAALNARANRLAHQLIAAGVTPDQRVAICVTRSPAMIIGMLAVLKAGGAYVPLDPDYPEERLAHILADAAPVILLADPVGRAALGANAIAARMVLDPNILPDQPDTNPQVPALTSWHLAYVIYTSGSTGTPKGVMVEHRQLVHQITALSEKWTFTTSDRVLQFCNPCFDVSVSEIFSALANGSALVLRTDQWTSSAQEFWRLSESYKITYMTTPVQFWRVIADIGESSVYKELKVICIGGETIPHHELERWLSVRRQHPVLANCYGPTETTIITTIFCINDTGGQGNTIGRPLPNMRAYLLDAYGQPVPLGAVGELYIGGAGVARGYLNRPELTAARFLTDPFSDDPDARMYRSGDLARYLPDGNLVFVGRNDQQVKIRGFRVEPGEIEARLEEHPLVSEALVVAFDDGQDKRLVSYVVAQADEELSYRLYTYLSAILPDYMVPTAFVCLPAFPLTPNGKLDRQALPMPDEKAFVRQIYEAPQGEMEIALASIWRNLLGIEQVSRHDNFFALGGHSLLAIRMIERLHNLGLTLAVRDLFQSPVLSGLAQTLKPHQTVEVPPNVITAATTALTPAMLPLIDLTQTEIDHIIRQVPGGLANIQDIYALSPLQDGILFHHLLEDEGDPYLLVNQMIFSDRILLNRYLEAVQWVVNRHDILRTAFLWQGLSVPVQVVWRQASLSVTELTLDPADGPVSEQLAQRFDSYHYRLDLNQAPLLRFVVTQETDGRWRVLELLHHLIGDHTTLEVMNREVQDYLAGQGDSLPAPAPFRNLVAQARLGISQMEHTRFFTDMLVGVSEPTLLFGIKKFGVKHQDASQITQSHRMLPSTLNDRLRNQARLLGGSLATLCHVALGQILSRISGQSKVVFGTVLFGRMQAGEGVDSGMGLFINTLPLKLDIDETSVRSSVQAAHSRLAELLEHEHASLALAQRCSEVASGTPLFNMLLNYRHNTPVASTDNIMKGVEFLDGQERTNYPFVLSIEDFGDALGLTAQAIQPFNPGWICGYMQQALESLVEALEQAPDRPIRALEILPETERTLLLKTWNATEIAYSEQLCIHQLFEQQVEKTPDAPALIYEEQTFSYAELNANANRLAHELIALGVGPDQQVVICMTRSPAMIMSVLAVLKAGGAYVPLDLAYPGARLRHILHEVAPSVVLADKAGHTALGETALGGMVVLDPNTLVDRPDNNPTVPTLTSRHLAYVIYTSGSTGMPKGVMVEHRGLVNLIQEKIIQFGISIESRVLQFAALGFDASIWEMMMALGSGASLVIATDTIRQDPRRLWHYLEQQAITHTYLPPALLQDGADLPELTIKPTVILGGEAPSALLLQALCDRVTLFNVYGPTEITVCATTWHCPSDYTGTEVPIGRPIANTQIYLLDVHGQPVPLGAVGELYIGGAGVARGYLNRPELTAERFLSDPFSDKPDARMYRTGDLARYLPDGNLVFVGRNDQQVKIRSFRIEPGEIAARLLEYPAVRDAVVLAQGDGYDKRLVAYVVAEPDDGLVNNLRAHLSAILPDYMVPAAFVRLDAFPLTPNGKLDRQALSVPDEKAFARQVYEAPQGEMEIALAAVWRELLGIEQVSRHDNFFALGGHSLLAVRMMNRITALSVELPLSMLFESPSLIAFAEAINTRLDKKESIQPVIVPISRENELPLSFAQQRLWFLAQIENIGDTYHIPMALRLRGQINIAAWQQALNSLFARHEALRSIFVSVKGQPQVKLLASDSGMPLVQHDLRAIPDVGTILERLSTEEIYTPFDLSRGPLIRACLIRLADNEYQFLLTQHHIVSDGWSVSVLMRELSTLYAAFLAGQPNPLPPLTVQYPDYAAWQRRWFSVERLQSQSDYWRTALAGVPVLLNLPTDRPRPPEQSFAGDLVPVVLEPALTTALKQLSEQQGTTLFMTLLSAWAIVLARLSGQAEVVIGTPSAGRNHQAVESLIGFFVNTLALRVDLSGEPNTAELLARVKQTALAAQEHQDLPFEQVVEIVQPSRQLAHTPLFQVMFAWQNNERTGWELPGLAVSPADVLLNTAKFDLELNLFEEEGQIVGALHYATALFDKPTLERHVGYLHTALQAMVADLQQPVGKMAILAPAERRLLLDTWNGTETSYPDPLCIHQVFEQQAGKTPEATALVYEEQTFSYAVLNARANRLAHQLIAAGVTPDQRVAICVTRSPAMIIGLLAVLKAGGAYVPLDPDYPEERLAHILADAAPVILLADQAGRAALGENAIAARMVLDPNILPDRPDTNPQVPALTSRHLAYVIYTSGSTGTPKGVMVEHRQLVHQITALNMKWVFTALDRVLQFCNPCFDVSVSEIFSALANGSALVLRTDQWTFSAQEFWRLCESYKITYMAIPVQFWRVIADIGESHIYQGLRVICIGGEMMPHHELERWLSVRRQHPVLANCYGPTETTIITTIFCMNDIGGQANTIGRPLPNMRVYLLDAYGQPVPLGAVGELYIGGTGVARGYLNRPELTAARFLTDPFSDEPDARMYRSGDLARYLPDGNLVFVGRNDQQVKIRGFRVEPEEIEARLEEHPLVREALVVAFDSGQDKRLVAYVVAPADEELSHRLYTYLSAILPDYMVPTAFVRLDAFPLTPNGKRDRQVLPVPDNKALVHQVYEAPKGERETALAVIWRELLGIEQISRHDNFFALGGHSLLAIRMIERLHNLGLTLAVRDLFQSPVLSGLAQTLKLYQSVVVPPNVITAATTTLTPAMLPLIDLTQPEIDHIIRQVPGGLANIQDIYALSPLQDGILFHHLLADEGDAYLLMTQQAFANRTLLDRYLAAVQWVVDRHDILRTAFLWQGLSVPVQVVWRQASLSVTELTLDPADGPVSEQLAQRFNPRHYRLDLRQAPLLSFIIARENIVTQEETDGRWILLGLQHHLIGDHTTLDVMNREVQAYLAGQKDGLPAPVPFRRLIAQARMGVNQEEHTRFFTNMLAEVKEPTLPFGLMEVYRNDFQVKECHQMLVSTLNERLRNQAKDLNVSLAALCHVAWAQVLSRTSGQQNVVFGTVLFGRMAVGEGTDSGMGMFINTLPLRLDMDATSVQESVQAAHRRLAELLEHEHASLALAQRCSGVQGETPLFSALLNYRHNVLPTMPDGIVNDIEFLGAQESTNYPLVLSVEDFGHALGLTVEVVQPYSPEQIGDYMQQALESLVEALEQHPETSVQTLEILPEVERKQLLETWNPTAIEYPDALCIHQLFEQQVEKTPDATALVYEAQALSYAELNARANRLAHQLIALGVEPDQRVTICVTRSPAMVIGILAVLKAGGAYVPLDPTYPGERLAHMLKDAAPSVVLVDKIGRTVLGDNALTGLITLDPNVLPDQPDTNPLIPALTPHHLAYVIYTSGSTGIPKGVMVEHQAVYQRILGFNETYAVTAQDRVLQFSSFAFDASIEEFFLSLCNGAILVMRDDSWLASIQAFISLARQYHITVMSLPTLFWSELATRDKTLPLPDCLRLIIIGGEAVKKRAIQDWFVHKTHRPQLLNTYGPTENTVIATYHEIISPENDCLIGRPISNTCIYLLDKFRQPVPLGCTGEIYIGGVGVARGYLNQPELTAERFLSDPFSHKPDARMYRPGDLARYLPDGNLEFLGRNDHQVKIRGFRIEPGEIEARLTEYPAVSEAVVLALGEGQEQRLVAYVVTEPDDGLINRLRTHVSAILPDYMMPAAFVRLEALPLTPTGKLDRRALPVPGEEAFVRQVYETPQGEIEIALAAIWCELLGIEKVGQHDNFFALGGHSLLAMRMMNLTAKRGLFCTLNALFQFPVLSELAAKIMSDWLSQPQRNAISVRSDGTQLPLFFVPSGIGDYSYAFGLAELMQSGYPIYALPWPSVNEGWVSTMEMLATRLIAFIKAVQPEGPYRICGYSSGGVLAYAIAQQLLNSGDKVDFLGLIDTFSPHCFRKLTTQLKHEFLTELAGQSGNEHSTAISALYPRTDELNWVQLIEFAQQLGLYPANLCSDLVARHMEQRENYARIVKDYVPETLTVTLHQFYATEPYPLMPIVTDSEQESLTIDRSLGWSEVMPASLLRLIAVPGDHSSLFEDKENRIVLAQVLNMALASNDYT